MGFEWDSVKHDANVKKHKISFEDAIKIFDGFVLETEDKRDYGEPRIWAIGETEGNVFFVVYTWRSNSRRIISARLAGRKEKETYYGQFEN
jgi:uncharacterized protein